MNNKQKLLNIVKNLNLTQSQQNELVNVLSSGLGSGGEDKVFEIKVKHFIDYDNTIYRYLMINGIGWFEISRSRSDGYGYDIHTLNGEPWENKSETIREIFKDIESYNKLKLTEIMIQGDMEIPLTTTEELICQFADTNVAFIIRLYSKVYPNNDTKYFLAANVLPNGTSSMAIAFD